LWIGRVYWLFPLREAINSGLMLHVSPAFARLFIIAAYIVPSVILSYVILRRYWSINRVSSVIASTFPFLLSFQDEIPLGINISYHVQDLLVALLALYITLNLVTARQARPLAVPLFAVLFFLLSESLVSSIIFIPALLLVALSHPGKNIKLRLATVTVLLASLASIIIGELEVSRKTASISNLSNLLSMFKTSLNSINPFFYCKTGLKLGYSILFWMSFCTGAYYSVSKSISRNFQYLSMLVWSLLIPIWSIFVYSITNIYTSPRYFFYFATAAYWMAGFGFIILITRLFTLFYQEKFLNKLFKPHLSDGDF